MKVVFTKTHSYGHVTTVYTNALRIEKVNLMKRNLGSGVGLEVFYMEDGKEKSSVKRLSEKSHYTVDD